MVNHFTVTIYCAITTVMPNFKTVYLVKTKNKQLYLTFWDRSFTFKF